MKKGNVVQLKGMSDKTKYVISSIYENVDNREEKIAGVVWIDPISHQPRTALIQEDALVLVPEITEKDFEKEFRQENALWWLLNELKEYGLAEGTRDSICSGLLDRL